MLTTAAAHGFRPGDFGGRTLYDNSAYWGDDVVYDCATTVGGSFTSCTNSSTTFRYLASGTISSQATPGVVALEYSAILDTQTGTHLTDLQYDYGGAVGHFNSFFDVWDDENLTIDHFNNNGISLNYGATWTGSFLFSGGAGGHGSAQKRSRYHHARFQHHRQFLELLDRLQLEWAVSR